MNAPHRTTNTSASRTDFEPAQDTALAGGGKLSAALRRDVAPVSPSRPVPSDQGDLVDVVIRLPRRSIETTLLSISATEREPAERRLGEARALLSGRRQRAACFRRVRFHDPSWDMILELYVATCEGRRLAVTQLCRLSGGSMTTALRHVEHLEALGYISRATDAADRRRVTVLMRPALQSAVDRWLDLQRAALHLGC